MGDLKLYQITNNTVKELVATGVAIEKSLQTLIETHIESFFGVQFLASEYSTGKVHGGRIDTLGIDENGCPVIIEYKRATNQNVINQGLYYLDWLMDHKAEFELLVLKVLGKDKADNIEWSNPRLLCIAADFTKYDQYAVQQMNRNIELIRYRRYADDLLMLELVNAVQADTGAPYTGPTTPKPKYSTFDGLLEKSSETVKDIYYAVKELLLSFGDDVQCKKLKYYVAFKRIKNFASVEVRPQNGVVLVFVKINLETVQLEKGFTRDVSNKGHLGTGNLEITLRSLADLEKARPLLEKSYELS
jgi:predicted transport protein